MLQNAPTQSLLSVVNGILDESVDRKNGEIPHVSYRRKYEFSFKALTTLTVLQVYTMEAYAYGYIFFGGEKENVSSDIAFVVQRVACLLRKVVQEIERRISTQADHLRTVKYFLNFLVYFNIFFADALYQFLYGSVLLAKQSFQDS